MKKEKQNETVVYQTKAGAIELNRDIDANTVWATQADIAEIFGSERSVITKHIRNLLKDRELNAKSVCAKMARTADDGKVYQVQFYKNTLESNDYDKIRFLFHSHSINNCLR